MGWLVLLAVVIAFAIGGGLYQLLTGRYVGIGRFASTYDPSPRVIRVTGAAGIVGGVCMILIWIGVSTGAIDAK